MTWLSHYIIFQIRKGNELTGWTFKVVFCLVISRLNQSESNAVLKLRTGHFRGLLGFETKDFKMCRQSLECSR